MRKYKNLLLVLALGLVSGFTTPSFSAQPDYGPNVTLEQAKVLAKTAAKKAEGMKLAVAIAIVDTSGQLVYFEKADQTQLASVEVSLAKARSANNFRRSTKVFEAGVMEGRTAILGLPGAVPIEGGIPIVRNQQVIGAIGISGATSEEDGIIAAAGLAGLD